MIQEILLLVCLILTLISTGMLIAYFIFKRDSRTYAFKLVLPIFLFDFFWALNVFVPLAYYFVNPDSQISKGACDFQGVVKLLTTNGSFFSALAISWTLYTFLIRNKPIQTKNPIIYYSGYTLILPLIISLIPLFCGRYGYIQPVEQVMCFLVLNDEQGETDYLGIVLRTFLYYLPFIYVLFLDFYYVARIYYSYRKNSNENFPREVKNLILYPMILLLSWIWLMIERIIEALNGGHQITWLNKFDLHGVALNGFLNAIVYGYLSINPFQMCYQGQESDYVASKDSLINLNSINKTMNKASEKSQVVSDISNSIHIKFKDEFDNTDEINQSNDQNDYQLSEVEQSEKNILENDQFKERYQFD